jgi:diketogulonate reductase-like aldo/keto reductase
MIERKIPSTGEMLPVIGLGTWQTFDIDPSSNLEPLKQVLSTMSDEGGRLIDSSPMYGRSEEIVGSLTSDAASNKFFYATKIWTRGEEEGIQQMENSFRKFKRSVIDLMQIHNLVDWKTHLSTLRKWKDEGRIRYIGITHYTDSMHSELAKIIKSEKIDFVQFNYSIAHRNAEKDLLPTVAEYGVATLINRPFGEGNLFNQVKGKEPPSWLKEYNIETWSQLFLKFIISHPAVTCVIPATSNPLHAADNMKAGSEPLPEESARRKMIEVLRGLS